MTDASTTTLICGLACAGIAGWMLAGPASFAAAVRAFPRSALSARVVTAVVMFWTARLLKDFPLDKWEHLKSYIPLLAVFSFAMLIYFLDELLAPRALGGLCQLIGVPVLDAIRWSDSSLRLVLTTGVYVLIVAGMILIMSPYRFRHFFEWLHRKPGRPAAWGAGLGVYGAALAVIALTALG
ncbi:MAG: hypothetical protein U1F87_19000 [Kiritimatiellia bacterium]